MPVMHTAIPYTSNTADQTVSTVYLQLGALSARTRPLTSVIKRGTMLKIDIKGGILCYFLQTGDQL